jgi:aryl carrier-like protein
MLVGMKSSDKPQNIGKLFPNCSGIVGTTRGTPTLRGCVGELFVGGHLVARGYLGRPELTQQKFVEYGLKGESLGRMFKTGDLVRMLADGTLEFMGRSDDQIKIRGIRIELGEINSVALKAHAHIKAVHTVAVKESAKDIKPTMLASFIVLETEGDLALNVQQCEILSNYKSVSNVLEAVNSACRDSLPSYMVPTFVIPITTIPLSPTGKADQGRLLGFVDAWRSTVKQTETEGAENETDWSDLELLVCETVSSVSTAPTSQISKASTIMELGIDSLNVIHLSRSLKRKNIDIAISDLLLHPTIAGIAKLAAKLSKSELSTSELEASNVMFDKLCEELVSSVKTNLSPSVPVIGAYPCTPLQSGLLFQSLKDNDMAYFNRFYFKVHDSVEVETLIHAWKQTIAQHDILRSHFIILPDSDNMVQYITSDEDGFICEIDTENDDLVNFIQERRDYATLENPLHISIIKTPTNTVVELSMHHAIYDGWSLDLLLDDVQRFYYGLTLPLRPPFRSLIQNIWSQDPAAAQKYWTDALNLSSPALFPKLTGLSTYSGSTDRYASRKCSVSLQLLEQVASSRSVSVQSIFQATWAKLVASYTGESDVIFGHVVSGRLVALDGVEDMVGPCFNTVPVRVNLDSCMTNAELIQMVHSFTVNSIPFQHTSLSSINSYAGNNGQPLFDTLFLFQRSTRRNKDVEALGKLWEPINTTSVTLQV